MVSKAIELYGAWELYTVNKVMEAMDHYKNAVFIGNSKCLSISFEVKL